MKDFMDIENKETDQQKIDELNKELLLLLSNEVLMQIDNKELS
jgi:hypothetical protein